MNKQRFCFCVTGVELSASELCIPGRGSFVCEAVLCIVGCEQHPCCCSHSGMSTLCDPVDYSPPGSSVRGILQASVLERVAMPISRGSSPPRDKPGSPALQAESLPAEPPGKPLRASLVSVHQIPGTPPSGEGNGTPLQCSCLENPRDGRVWWAAVYGITQSRT